jgi:hypothetical protein
MMAALLLRTAHTTWLVETGAQDGTPTPVPVPVEAKVPQLAHAAGASVRQTSKSSRHTTIRFIWIPPKYVFVKPHSTDRALPFDSVARVASIVAYECRGNNEFAEEFIAFFGKSQRLVLEAVTKPTLLTLHASFDIPVLLGRSFHAYASSS